MKEELISFDTAKLAKEKGFKCEFYFGYVTKFYRPSTGTLISYGRTGNSKREDLIYAPTQSLLQRWLREVHFIETGVAPVRYAGDEKTSYYQPILNGSNIMHKNKYTTWESALEIALQQALTLINK